MFGPIVLCLVLSASPGEKVVLMPTDVSMAKMVSIADSPEGREWLDSLARLYDDGVAFRDMSESGTRQIGQLLRIVQLTRGQDAVMVRLCLVKIMADEGVHPAQEILRARGFETAVVGYGDRYWVRVTTATEKEYYDSMPRGDGVYDENNFEAGDDFPLMEAVFKTAAKRYGLR